MTRGGGSISWGADHPLSLRFARLAGTLGYSKVSLSAEIHLITKVSLISYSSHYCIEYHQIKEDLKTLIIH